MQTQTNSSQKHQQKAASNLVVNIWANHVTSEYSTTKNDTSCKFNRTE